MIIFTCAAAAYCNGTSKNRIYEKRVLGSTWTKIYYLYDASGICGFEYVCGSYTNTYYFGKNAQGDVVFIFIATTIIIGAGHDQRGSKRFQKKFPLKNKLAQKVIIFKP